MVALFPVDVFLYVFGGRLQNIWIYVIRVLWVESLVLYRLLNGFPLSRLAVFRRNEIRDEVDQSVHLAMYFSVCRLFVM